MQSSTGAADPAGRARLAPGSVLASRYVIEELLGEGGEGEVYRAFDRELGREVAIKVLSARRARSPEAIARMRRETSLAQTITHPSVCRVHDFGMGAVASPSTSRDATSEQPTLPYLSMELLRGETLAQRVERDGPLDPEGAAAVAVQMARALRSAHRAGVVHGDVKPSNVMLVGAAADDGHVAQRIVLTDFGLSRLEAAPPSEPDGEAIEDASSVPAEGSPSSIAGTPLCLAPEQVLGRPLTRATDVFSFGVVLYHALSGSWPFEGRSRIAVALARLEQEPVPLRERRPDLEGHPALVALIGRCLELDPERRPSDMDGVLEGLRSYRNPRAGRSRRVLAVLGAVAVVAVLGTFVLLALRAGRVPVGTGPGASSASAPAASGFPAWPSFDPHGTASEPLAPSSPPARAHWQAGLAALNAGDPSTAVRELSAARDATGAENALVWIELSRAWELAGNQRLAREAAEQAYALRAAPPRGEQLLAEAQLRIAESDWKRAATVLRALWEFYPDRSRYGYELAGVLDRDGRLEEAREVIRAVRERFGRESTHLDLRESLIEYHLGDYDRSAELARAAAELARASGQRLLEAEAFDLEALTQSRNGEDLEAVEALLREAEVAFREVGHLAKVAAVTRRLGHVDRRRGAFDEAEEHYRVARALAQESEDPATFAGATGDLAVLLDTRGRIGAALGLKREVLSNYEERGIRQGVAITRENIGISLFKLGRLEEAMAAMRAAEAEYERLGDRIGLAWAPYHQGRVWSAMGRIELAQRSFDLAQAAASESEEGTLASYLCFESAELDWMRARGQRALATSRSCAAQYRSAGQDRDVADAELQEARILGWMARWSDAAGSARRALDGYQALGVEQGVAESRAVLLLALLEGDDRSSAKSQLDALEATGTEHGVARLRAEASVSWARAHLAAAAARATQIEQAVSALGALSREANELGLVPLAMEIDLLRLRLEPDPLLEQELRDQATERDLLFVLEGLDGRRSTVAVTVPAESTLGSVAGVEGAGSPGGVP